MKILHVNTSATAGGAAIAARRIIRAEQRYGLQATMLTRDDDVERSEGRRNFLLERLGVWVHEGLRRHNLWAIDPATHGSDITRLPQYKEADVIHLHWINQGMLSLDGISDIIKSGKPIVWTMHDMWPFTGICHHADDCQAWRDGTACHKCRYNSRLAQRTYQRKAAIFGSDGTTTQTPCIHFVACSQWLAGLASQAPLLNGHTVLAIPNPIDTHFYRPFESMIGEHGGGVVTVAPSREALRQSLGLPQDRQLILFVAYKATDPNKGLRYLLEATHDMDADIVIVGKDSESVPQPSGRRGTLHLMGLVNDRQQMRTLYQACNVLAMPTLKDNLPNTIVEGMSCGLPCVGFRIGGVPEMIDHLKNGYLADYMDTDDLRRGLDHVLRDADYTHAARLKAVQTYSEASVAARYAHLYEQSLMKNL